eukprot:6382233-Pyramimonas_sp.AAC.1
MAKTYDRMPVPRHRASRAMERRVPLVANGVPRDVEGHQAGILALVVGRHRHRNLLDPVRPDDEQSVRG